MLFKSCLGQQAPVRINCGGEEYKDSENNQWLPDLYFLNGQTFSTSESISSTLDDALMQTERFSNDGKLLYRIPTTPGVYDVRLQFSENYNKNLEEGKRVFHVLIENVLAFQDLDIYKEAGNRGYRRIEKEYRTRAIGGSILIEFVPQEGNPKVNTIEILPASKQAVHPDIRAVIPVEGDRPQGIKWADSYSVGDKCYCDGVTTYDHDIGKAVVETSLGWMTVKQACELLGPGPGIEGHPVYNDVQCGNGPPNDYGDEHRCPGRVDMGREGCGHIGPKWNFGTNFATSVDSTMPVVPPVPRQPTPKPDFVLNAGSNSDDGSLVKEKDTWKYSAGSDFKIKGNKGIPQYFFRTHRSSKEHLTYTMDGFDKNKLYRVKLGFAEVWGANCMKNGSRIMSVQINNRMYRNDLDVYKEAGCGGALVLSYVLKPDNRGKFKIMIGAKPQAEDNNAMISLIEIGKP